MSARLQRLRLTFARGDALRYVGHLDLQRFWERALRRAGIAVAYSEGFTPHAQITLGAPLPIGMTARADLIDIYLAERVEPDRLVEQLRPRLPAGVEVSAVQEVPVHGPATQALLRAAEYTVELPEGSSAEDAKAAVAALLARDALPWEHQREKDVRRYDLRPLVEWLHVEEDAGRPLLRMRLRAEPGATGRPDHVAAALGYIGPLTICRLRLILAQDDEQEPAESGRGAALA